ncbi:cysteate racemase [Sphingobacterium lactis]|uniref:Aspartate racemase n=1 Tax=Sphingobacterium lactis TaxID=797291 RepID=A0A1H5ZKD5_9SPHI|nr:amino acid racemase [Sphingobacterium lactis]SEG36117.1 aspartate racemase [Sphingobacterium lactis]
MIGIVGGVGPLAGVDIVKKIIEETNARRDQDHLPVLLSSQSHRIADRTEYLLGKVMENPGVAIAEIARELEQAGATVLGVPCNTAHAPRIFDVIKEQLHASGSNAKLLNMIEETANFISEHYPQASVGVLSTIGTRNTGQYKNVLERYGLTCVEPNDALQEKIHAAIYDETYGIKAYSSPVTNRAHDELVAAIQELKGQGAQVIILGCTELPLALREKSYYGLPVVDPNRILARALIANIAPEKLNPLAE